MTHYGYLVFNEGEDRTYKYVASLVEAESVAPPASVLPWSVVANASGDMDYFSYNYAAASGIVVYDPLPEPEPTPVPVPDAITGLLFAMDDNVFELMIGISALVKVYADPSYAAGRIMFWDNAKRKGFPRYLLPHIAANLEHWCRWYGVDIV